MESNHIHKNPDLFSNPATHQALVHNTFIQFSFFLVLVDHVAVDTAQWWWGGGPLIYLYAL
jgi:hypothetical protein